MSADSQQEMCGGNIRPPLILARNTKFKDHMMFKSHYAENQAAHRFFYLLCLLQNFVNNIVYIM